jgi:hypothetical protein
VTLPLILAVLLFLQQTGKLFDQIEPAAKAVRTQLAPPIDTPERLRAALLAGGTVDLAAGARFSGSFTAAVRGTIINGHGAQVLGSSTAEALRISASDVAVHELGLTTASTDTVLRCGANDSSQTTVAQVPTNVVLDRVTVPTHRGKRGIEWNCTGTIDGVEVLDTWDPAGRDSQGLAILNTPGPVRVLGGRYQAGSEGILVGGDTMKIAGVEVTDLLFDRVEISRPLSWKTDGVPRKIKNLLELKRGRRVVVRNGRFSGAWQDGQDGYAIVITPHSGGDIHDVLVERSSMTNVGGCFNLLGQEYHGIPTPAPLSGFVERDNVCVASKTLYGGRGIFALITGEPADLTFTGGVSVTDGTATILYDPGKVLTADGTTRQGGPIAALTVTDKYFRTGIYGINLAGVVNAGPSPKGVVKLVVTGNTIAGASAALKKNLPQNTYVDRVAFDALFVDAANGDYRRR